MRRTNIIFNLLLLIASVYFFTLTFSFPTRFGIEDSGPALFPRVGLGILVLLLLLDTFAVLKKKNEESFFTQEEKSKLGRFGLFIGIIFVFVFLLGKIYFLFLSMVVLFLLCLIVKVKWTSSIVTSVLLSLLIYFVFIKGLNIII